MPNALCSSPSVSRRPFRFPSMSLPAVSWLLPWRVIWLAFGLWFAWAIVTADLKMSAVYSGEMQPVPSLLAQADSAVSRFPYDPYLRAMRRNVRKQIAAIPPRAGTDK